MHTPAKKNQKVRLFLFQRPALPTLAQAERDLEKLERFLVPWRQSGGGGRLSKARTLLLALLALAGLLQASSARSADEAPSLQQRLDDLNLRQKALERLLENKQQAGDSRQEAAAQANAGAGKLFFASADGAWKFQLDGYFQVDSRNFISDSVFPQTNTFLLRNARLNFDLGLGKGLSARLAPEFGLGKASIQDAYFDLELAPWLKLRAGKFKAPLGLERLQTMPINEFPELGLPSNLVPNRDLGAIGEFSLWNLGSLQAGIFNGVADGSSGDASTQDDKEAEARLFLQPLQAFSASWFKNLGFGAAGSYGNRVAGPLPSFVTASQTAFFSYATGVSATGQSYRIAPQAYWYYANFGLLGEYVNSGLELQKSGPIKDLLLANEAWQVLANWVISGEEASYQGPRVSKALDFSKGTWGAWELVGRYGALNTDGGTPASYIKAGSATKVIAWGAGINWYPSASLRLTLAWDQSQFTGGGIAANSNRETENVVTGRAQVVF